MHGLPSSQPIGTQAPPQQVWLAVQREGRVHVVPLQTAISQVPGVGMQLVASQPPVTWQPACGSQCAPAPVQRLSVGTFVHAPVVLVHESSVHDTWSSHRLPRPGWQTPPAQTSPTVHGLSSLQASVLAVLRQPVEGSQASVVQGLPSVHGSTAPAPHVPSLALQAPSPVQTFRSSQGPACGTCSQLPDGLQKSVVHGRSSAQPAATHVVPQQVCPPAHMKERTQVLPSQRALRQPSLAQLVVVQLGSWQSLTGSHVAPAPGQRVASGVLTQRWPSHVSTVQAT